MIHKLTLLLFLAAMLILSGCDHNPDQQLSKMSQRYAEWQAELSRQTVALQQEVVTMQRELHSQRDRLEQERRDWASFRYWESLLATAIQSLGLVVVCLLPLTICWMLLRQAHEPVSDQEVVELLLNDLTSRQPRLWHSPLPLLPEAGARIETAACPASMLPAFSSPLTPGARIETSLYG